MKNILALLVCAIIFSCSSDPQAETAKENVCTQYACPVHPDNTSSKPAECPECHRKMVPVSDKGKIDTAKGKIPAEK